MTRNGEPNRVIVAGAGYAGVLAANRLAGRLPRANVMLVSPGGSLIDRFRLHEAVARGRDVRRPLSELLDERVEAVDARVVGVDPDVRQVRIEHGDGSTRMLDYDALLLALGSRLAPSIPSAPELAHALEGATEAQAWHAKLRVLKSGHVRVVGGGPTAIETAAEIAEAHPRLQVELMTDVLAPGLDGAPREALREALREVGVVLREGATVREIEPDAVRLEDGTRLQADVPVLAAGFRPAPLGEGFALPRATDGRLAVDAFLRVGGRDGLFAAGDICAPPPACVGSGKRSARMSCATAMPMGAHAADQMARWLNGRPLRPYHFAYFFQCISIGRRRAVVAFVDADDQPTGKVWTGRKAAWVKELICRFVFGAIRMERAFAGFYSWPGERKLPRLQAPTEELPDRS